MYVTADHESGFLPAFVDSAVHPIPIVVRPVGNLIHHVFLLQPLQNLLIPYEQYIHTIQYII